MPVTVSLCPFNVMFTAPVRRSHTYKQLPRFTAMCTSQQNTPACKHLQMCMQIYADAYLDCVVQSTSVQLISILAECNTCDLKLVRKCSYRALCAQVKHPVYAAGTPSVSVPQRRTTDPGFPAAFTKPTWLCNHHWQTRAAGPLAAKVQHHSLHLYAPVMHVAGESDLVPPSDRMETTQTMLIVALMLQHLVYIL
jgi:hypothetical protein